MVEMQRLKSSVMLIASTGAYTIGMRKNVGHFLEALHALNYPYSVWITKQASTERRDSSKAKRDRAAEIHARRLTRFYDAGDGSTSDSTLAAFRMGGTRTLFFDEIKPQMDVLDPSWWGRRAR